MKINIFGSTGNIGVKSLNLIKTYFPKIKINLLCAKDNIKLLEKIFRSLNFVFITFIKIYLLIVIISSKLFIYAKDNEKKTKYYLKLNHYNFCW